MVPMKVRLFGLLAIVSAISTAPAIAKERQLTPDEARIAQAIDKAVRGDASLKSLARLPWAEGAAIWRPEILENLPYCTPSHAQTDGDKMVLFWDEAAERADVAHPCGQFGYVAFIVLQKGRIKSVTLGEQEIIVT